jgi:hypothetical protein
MILHNHKSNRVISNYKKKDNLQHVFSENNIMNNFSINKNRSLKVKSLSNFLDTTPESLKNLKHYYLIQHRNRMLSQESTAEKLFNNPNISQKIKNKYSNVFLETLKKENDKNNISINEKLKNYYYNKNIDKDNTPIFNAKKREIMKLLIPNNNRDNSKSHFIEKLYRKKKNEGSSTQRSDKSYMNSEINFPYKKMINFRIHELEKILNRKNKK